MVADVGVAARRRAMPGAVCMAALLGKDGVETAAGGMAIHRAITAGSL